MELRDVLAPLVRWWWLLLLSTLIAAASGFGYMMNQPEIYRATSTLMIGNALNDPNPNGGEFGLVQQLGLSYIDLIRRTPVRNGTMQALGMDWLPEYQGYIVPNTQLLGVTVVDTDPVRAQMVANELVEQLILQTPTGMAGGEEGREAFTEQLLNQLEQSIMETQKQIREKQTALGEMYSARQIADTRSEISSLQNALGTLQNNYALMRASTQQGAINTLRVVEPAALPSQPERNNGLMTIAVAAALGLALAAAAAYILEYLDDTLRRREEIEEEMGLTVMGTVPKLRKIQYHDLLNVKSDEQSIMIEAFRELSININHTALDRPIGSLLVTSPATGDGKTMSVAKLALTLASRRQRVVLIDADLRRPHVHQIFGLENDRGLTTALVDHEVALSSLLRESGIPGLSILVAGHWIDEAISELLGTDRLHTLLNELKTLGVDMVIIDSPPVNAVADAVRLSTQVDGVLLVVDMGRTKRKTLQDAVKRLRHVHANVLGAVMNRVPLNRMDYYLSGYYGPAPSTLRSTNGKPTKKQVASAR